MWAKGARARHPKTTLPHRPPGPLAAVGLPGGGVANPPGPILWFSTQPKGQ